MILMLSGHFYIRKKKIYIRELNNGVSENRTTTLSRDLRVGKD